MAVPADSFFTQRTVLGAATFILTFRYNARMDRWICDVADANNVAIVTGMVVLTLRNVWGRFAGKVPGLPVGAMFALDMTGQGRDPQLGTLGGDVPLVYVQ